MNEYPNLWKRGLIQEKIRNRADHKCEQCGMEFNHGTNIATHARNRKGKPMIGTVHHIDENKQNCSMNNLVFLCQSCHYTIHCNNWKPGDFCLVKWKGVPQWIIDRNIPYLPNPQLPLFEVH